MEKTRIIFFDIKDYDREFFEKYGKNYNFEMSFFKSRLSLENVHLTKGYDVVCAFTNDDIGKETIDAMAENGVRLLAMRCAGFNNVSLKDIHNRFKVVRVPAYSPHAIAEYTVGLILAVNRKINKAYVRTREGNFSINGLMGVDLYGKTAGIIGTGKIGQILIKILKGFDMKVIAYDLFPNQKVADELGFEYVSLDELYANSDIISLNCPLTKDTQYMINRRSMLKMKDGVILVNTGRGQLIDSADLVEALKDKKVGAVALDVYEEEEDYFFEDKSTQVIEDDILGRLLSFYNVLITSHQAYFTKEAVEAITVTTLNNIKDKNIKGNVVISIRPEEFVIDENQTKDGIKAFIDSSVFLGLNTHYFAHLESGEKIEIVQESKIDSIIPKGTEVYLKVKQDKINVFTEDGSRNILEGVNNDAIGVAYAK